MNKILSITAIFSLLFFVGCTGENDLFGPTDLANNGGNPTVSGSFTAIVDGNAWVADTYAGVLGSTTGPNNSYWSGVVGNETGINITFDFFPEETTYNQTVAGVTIVYISDISNPVENFYQAGLNIGETTFELNVTNIDLVNSMVSGTFSAYLKNGLNDEYITITEGVFTNIPVINEGDTGDSNQFTLNYDNESYTLDQTNYEAPEDWAGAYLIGSDLNANTVSFNRVTVPANLTVPGPDFEVGTYTIDDSGRFIAAISLTAGSSTYVAQSGTVTFDTVNPWSGSYNVVAVNPMTSDSKQFSGTFYHAE